jgi:hypothetical protein
MSSKGILIESFFSGSRKAHTKDNIIALAKKLSEDEKYEKVFIFVTAHGQIVGENYGYSDVVTSEERVKKGHYIAMDSNVLTIPLVASLKLMDIRRIIPEIMACYNVPFYRHKNTWNLFPTKGFGDRPDHLDYSEPFYPVTPYGFRGRFEQALSHFIDKKGTCKFAVAVFSGRYALASPSEPLFQ